ncbi:GNAT family N-acetyltransferase [Massilibacterium senegalense]|uniref:GNAT family N-acetyltransferase n=1 Tax=Massilibacterium senegalense TaxID=1632858 RepID=UPI0007838FB6|nr:GNAT family N-acetyltransferase [Massilibacterium senegalense]
MEERKHILWQNEGFFISTDTQLINREVVFEFLSTKAYWAKGIDRALVNKSIDNASICFGVYEKNKVDKPNQVGFARIISDFSIIAYLADVFILEQYRGQGLARILIEVILSYPEFKTLRRFILSTLDAHDLYKKFGFVPVTNPNTFMQISRQTYS